MDKTRPARQRIIEALFQLANEKGYDQVSVKQIAKVAGVSRMTFYRNFKNKEDVIIGQFHDTFSEFIHRLMVDKVMSFNGLATAFFEIIKENQNQMTVLVKNNLTNLLLSQLKANLTSLIDENIIQVRGTSSKMMVAFIAGGLTEIIIAWTEDQMSEPVEELVIFASKYMHLK